LTVGTAAEQRQDPMSSHRPATVRPRCCPHFAIRCHLRIRRRRLHGQLRLLTACFHVTDINCPIRHRGFPDTIRVPVNSGKTSNFGLSAAEKQNLSPVAPSPGGIQQSQKCDLMHINMHGPPQNLCCISAEVKSCRMDHCFMLKIVLHSAFWPLGPRDTAPSIAHSAGNSPVVPPCP